MKDSTALNKTSSEFLYIIFFSLIRKTSRQVTLKVVCVI